MFSQEGASGAAVTSRTFGTADVAGDGDSGDWPQGGVEEGGRGGGDMRDSVYIMPPPPCDIGSGVSGIAVSRYGYLFFQELIQRLGGIQGDYSCEGSN